ncbi:hypothetical protein OIDMADRAFT_102489 [Oidiodendron maius Zn]|uniref:Nucleoporin NSP1 n=1 Tax=Oidiodendron maius (strain Zn) TaxID=913774 RepID=A0A0C3DQ84_OIDMZ|nr:hypothetical protein OIDMADRAFT_102489 [Oidiodendron maius Zn]
MASPFNFGSAAGSSTSAPTTLAFGQPATAPSQATKNLFGGPTAGGNQQASIFGTSSSTPSATPAKMPVFGLGSGTGGTPSGGMFGGNTATTTSSSTSTGGMFGTANTSSSSFGSGLFGQKKDEGSASISSEIKPSGIQGLGFGTPTSTAASGSTTPAPTKTFSFSTTPAGPPPTDNNQASKTPAGGLFGTPKTGDSAGPKSGLLFSGTTTPNTNLFGPKPPITGNLFGGTPSSTPASSAAVTTASTAPATDAAKSLFGFPSSTQGASTIASQATTSTTAAPAAGTSSLFGGLGKTTQPTSAPGPTSSLFPSLSGTSTTTAAPSTNAPAPSTAPSLFKLGTPSTAAVITTAPPTTAPAPASNPFGAVKPASTPITQPSSTAAAPSATAAATATSTTGQSSTQPLGASTAGPTPQLSRLKNKTMDEIITRWASDLLKYQKEFQEQAAKAATWDRLLVENGEKIQKLYSSTYEAERASTEVERQLATVESQQAELTAWLDRYEAEVDEVFTRQIGQGESLQGPDQERERTYHLAEKLTDRLDEMGKNITSMIEAVNDASSNLSKSSKADDPLSHIVRVLNSHLMQLQWIDQNAEQLQAKVTAAQKAAQGHTSNGYGGGDGDGVEAFYKSFGGRR